MKSSSGHKPRIAMLSIEDAKKAAIAEGIPETMAPLSIFRILLKNPPLAREIGNTLNMLLFKGNQLDGRLRELIIMRLGWATGSNYEWTQHWRVAVGMKIPEDVILAVKDWKNSKIRSRRYIYFQLDKRRGHALAVARSYPRWTSAGFAQQWGASLRRQYWREDRCDPIGHVRWI